MLSRLNYPCITGSSCGFRHLRGSIIYNMSDEEKKGTFGDLLKKFFTKLPAAGELVKGTVISVDNGAVRIDVNGITTGVIRGHELFSESEEFSNTKIGDEVEATVIEQENENGEMELSFRAAGHEIVWKRMEELVQSGLTIEGKIVNANKGGLMVQVDALIGFMPVSQLSPENYPRVPGGDKNRILEHLKQHIGKAMQVKVLDANKKNEKLIVSEKAVWEDSQKAVLDAYKIGDIIEGEVGALTSFGAFIKFGEGLEGLVHISEIAWQRIDHPKDVLKIGDRVKAQIIDLNKSKIYLSIKRLVDDPWKSVKDSYKIGQIVEGEIHKVEPFGLMIRLDNDIHGLAHISELSNAQMSEDKMGEEFKVGDVKKFEIVNIEPAEHRLGLRLEGVKPKVEAKKEEKKVEEKSEAVAEEKEEEKVEEQAAE
ncbi:MAG: 30S ribosomal protein S1 [Candidatus Magasanikbacteria bacterium CG10_big_fil_rev_8_21_14_0_10_42_10]|uniref:30S ribosomal protein S1 n=2 Tax=Candidatus Magasanikiibacteriota TaxID=1752731 RepID=A0A2H0TVI1_9BACT|nr:MAG: 30S ribosomal protein S1 [Candidatus Magasanikbacteria bacterium CG10_big_fil_rev_8_21_14_0_10_42_10]PIZ94581.1 MAG: 30S ribosomal protein S1 [Candidatus Magasanikbacteria bacterium CG_4_10_14_0_2_um_filter_41_10]